MTIGSILGCSMLSIAILVVIGFVVLAMDCEWKGRIVGFIKTHKNTRDLSHEMNCVK